MKHKLRMEPEQVLQAVTASVTLARNFTADVEWSAEDGSRTEHDFLCRCVEAAIAAGATTINIPDTVGYAVPEELGAIFAMLRERVPGADGGGVFRTTTTISAWPSPTRSPPSAPAPARSSAPSTASASVPATRRLRKSSMALRTRHDALPVQNGIVTESILRTSKLLATITGFDVQPNKAIVGRNAFAHESGIHQDGMLKNARTYEIMTPESVGWTHTSLVMGKHSGRAAFRDKLRALGYGEIGDNALNDAFRRFKEVADRKKIVYDEDLVALVDDEVMRDHDHIKFVALDVHAGSRARRERNCRSTSMVSRNHRPRRATARSTPRSTPSARYSRTTPNCAVFRGCRHRRHRRPGPHHGASGGGRQDGRRPGRRHRYDRGVRPRLRARTEQAAGKRRRTEPVAMSA